jgi:hypothetical protein
MDVVVKVKNDYQPVEFITADKLSSKIITSYRIGLMISPRPLQKQQSLLPP